MSTEDDLLRFATLPDCVAALSAIAEPLALLRFEPTPNDNEIVALNDAAIAHPLAPQVGDHPDQRRDRQITADVEIDYLYRQLVERGHAGQVLSIDRGKLYEVTVRRVEIDDDTALYGFVSVRLRGLLAEP